MLSQNLSSSPILIKLLITVNGDYMKLISKLTLVGVLSFSIPAFVATHAIAKEDNNSGKSSVAADSTAKGKSVIRGARGVKAGNEGKSENSSKDSSTPLDATEASHLTFMREEEKLARDVYLTFAASYPDQQVFDNIANKSEQTHTDTMRDKLELYNLEDPNPETNNLPDSLGVFTGDEWGWYFNEKFAQLTAKGAISELDALYVGAFIEELDMNDIADCPQVMLDSTEAEYPDPCGLHYTDEMGLINAYSFLIDGSERHLRAFVGQIEAVEGECSYEAQYLSQEDVDAILGRTCVTTQ